MRGAGPELARGRSCGKHRNRANLAKAQSYVLLVDTRTLCKNVRCRKRFDISGIKAVAFM